jgi:hypothetical protein
MKTQSSTAEALTKALVEVLVLLDGVSEEFWSEKILAASREPVDVSEVLSWYGGMGSFNDLMIAAANGHTVAREAESLVNNRLDELRRSIYELAGALLPCNRAEGAVART